MKNIVIISCLMILTLKASEHPPFSSPDLRNSTHILQDQVIPTNNPRVRLSLSDRMRQLNPSLNLDVNQLLASANTNPSATNQSPK